MTMEKFLQKERERLTRFVMIEPSSLKQSFKKKLGWNQGDIVYFQKQK